MMSLKKIGLTFFLIFNFSCVQNLDLNQLDGYTYSPAYTASLVYFTLEVNHFYDESGTIALNEITDETGFEIFEYSYIRDDFVKIAFVFDIKNEFNQAFTAEIELLDAIGLSVYRFQDISIIANSASFSQEELIEFNLNPTIVDASKLKVTIKKNSTIPIDINDASTFEFKSTITTYLEISI